MRRIAEGRDRAEAAGAVRVRLEQGLRGLDRGGGRSRSHCDEGEGEACFGGAERSPNLAELVRASGKPTGKELVLDERVSGILTLTFRERGD